MEQMKKVKPLIARSAQELGELLGLPAGWAEEAEMRRALVNKIIAAVAGSEITHATLAARAGTSRTRLTAILGRRISGVSTDLLLRILPALGHQAKITFRKTA
jgi:hypothetical protein